MKAGRRQETGNRRTDWKSRKQDLAGVSISLSRGAFGSKSHPPGGAWVLFGDDMRGFKTETTSYVGGQESGTPLTSKLWVKVYMLNLETHPPPPWLLKSEKAGSHAVTLRPETGV